MIEMKKIVIYVILSIFISGCAATSKAVRPEIPYSQITDLLSEFIDMHPVESTSGQPEFLGTSENDLVTLGITGDKDNITQASMKLVYPKDINPVNADLNRVMMLRFFRNVAPEVGGWTARVEDIIKKFNSMQIGSIEEAVITLDGRIIQISYDRNIDSITLTLKLK